METADVLILGAGQAGYQLSVSLRDAGFAGSIMMLGDDLALPYQRPPLSKGFLSGAVHAEHVTFQDSAFYVERTIELVTGTRVVRIDRAARTVETSDGKRIGYGQLVLALGARNRTLAHCSAALDGVFALRTLGDAEALRNRLAHVQKVVVVGGGFLGLEFAGVAAAKGLSVTVIEATGRLMSNAVSAPVSEAFRAHHEALGVNFCIGTGVASIGQQDGRATSLETTDGRRFDADLVVVSIGVVPNSELAADAGLKTDNGILVDLTLCTSDPFISAIGDCAAFPSRFLSGANRLESIQNAVDQARHLALRLMGKASEFDAVPWFWSDQGGLKLQIAGLNRGADMVVLRGDVQGRRFSAFSFRGGKLVAVESVSRPADHMLARRLLGAQVAVSVEQLADEGFDLRSLLPVAA